MNRIYNVVWNRALRTLQVASELTRTGNGVGTAGTATAPRRRYPAALPCLATLLMASLALPASALATTPVIVAGTLTGTDLTLENDATGTAISVTGSVLESGTAQLSAPYGAIDIASTGTVSGVTGVVLNGAAGITAEGTIIAGTLSGGSSSGGASLNGPYNVVDNLGDFSTRLGFSLKDTAALDVSGTASGTDVTLESDAIGTAISVTGNVDASGTARLSTPVGAIDIASTGTVEGVTGVVLNGAAGITASGTIIAGTLSGGSSSGGASLNGPYNVVDNLGDFSTRLGFSLKDTAALDVSGTASGTDVTLESDAIGTAISLTGNVDASGTARLSTPVGAIDIASTGTVEGVTGVVLNGAAGITASGTIIAGTLSGGSSSGGASLNGPYNVVDNLGDFSTKLGFSLKDTAALDVSGTASGTDVTLESDAIGTAISVTGNVDASGTARLSTPVGAIDIASNGTVEGVTGVVLNGAAGITASGTIIAGTLSGGSSSGGASLNGPYNVVDNLGDFSTASGFSLKDTAALDVSGTVSGTDVTLESDAIGTAISVTGNVDASGTARLSTPVGAIDIASNGTVEGVTGVVLNGAAGITASGTIIAGTLSGVSSSGGASLNGPYNVVDNLGDFSTGLGFSLADTAALDVSGTASGTDVTLEDDATGTAISVTGNVIASDTAHLASTLGAIDIASTGAVEGGVVDLDSADALTIDGAVRGGMVELSAVNNTLLTGVLSSINGTTIVAGALQVGNGGTKGSIVGDVTDGTGLIFDRSNAVTYAGVISGAGTLMQGGAGVLTLDGDSSEFTGATTVQSSSLIVGDTAGDNAALGGGLRVESGATLGGFGAVGSAGDTVTVEAGGALSPGGELGSVGTLTVNGALAMYGNLDIDIDGNGAFDLLDVAGKATFGTNSIFTFMFGNFSQAAGESFQFLDANSIDGFTDVGHFSCSGLMSGLACMLGMDELDDGSYGLKLTLEGSSSSVPEPGSLGMMSLGLLLLGGSFCWRQWGGRRQA